MGWERLSTRLKGEQIPKAARLFAIIDVWDAFRSDRPYRQGWSKEKVIEHNKSLSGTHFEPKAVELFLNMMNEDEKNAGE
jgi:HD-GYP domain-containing protein (c-di-GMP phosphodiesterase class II)